MILVRSGLSPRGAAKMSQASGVEKVRRLWQTGCGRQALAERLGLSVFQVAVCLATLRRQGVPLRPAPRMPAPKMDAVAKLFRRGLTATQIVRLRIASPPLVQVVKDRLRARVLK